MMTLNKEQIYNYVRNNPDYFDFLPHEIKGRLNTNENLSVIDIQKKFIKEIYSPLTPDEIEKITPFTQKAESELYPILHKVGITISEPMNWIIIKAKNGYNWNTCYTQGNVIVLSENRLNGDDNLVRVLAHEMIHIYQRRYPKLFRNFYKKKMGFSDYIPTEKELEDFETLGINDVFVQNPDNCEIGLMVYKEKYLPITIILPNEKQPVNVVLELTENGVVWDKEKKHSINAYNKTTLDQPNEMFAYMVTKNINNTSIINDNI